MECWSGAPARVCSSMNSSARACGTVNANSCSSKTNNLKSNASFRSSGTRFGSVLALERFGRVPSAHQRIDMGQERTSPPPQAASPSCPGRKTALTTLPRRGPEQKASRNDRSASPLKIFSSTGTQKGSPSAVSLDARHERARCATSRTESRSPAIGNEVHGCRHRRSPQRSASSQVRNSPARYASRRFPLPLFVLRLFYILDRRVAILFFPQKHQCWG